MESPVFGPAEEAEADQLVRLALAEDLPGPDVTSEALIPPGARARGAFVPRGPGVVCGLPVVLKVFSALDARISARALVSDGREVEAGERLLELDGPARGILAGERTALNFIQRLSGIATRTRRFRERLAGTGVELFDTRKTLPGWRHLEKYAVRAGGGTNHRRSLSDQALIKDNHVRILRALGGSGPREWVAALRQRFPGTPVELEVESIDELREALESGADVILLDNMSCGEMAAASREARRRPGPRPALEASGGIGPERLQEVAASGVDRISVGALTHSAPALDIGFDLREVM
jgi:nicotinate-nucleotide pyrophosphorylase (carboxylating)